MKIIPTLLSLILLLSSLNLSVVRHFCGGRVAEVKLSILGDASCGMEKNEEMCSSDSYCSNAESVNKKNCCEDELTQISVTDNYKPASNSELTNLQLSFIAFHTNSVFSCKKGHDTPVRNYKAPPDSHSVSLPFIQVFLV